MKIKTIIKLADVLDDSRRMPCDMYKLDEVSYVSESRGDSIPIADMDIVHLVRAFKKDRAKCVNHVTDADLIKQNRDLVSANKTLGRLHDMWKEKSMNMVEKSSYDALKEQLDQEVRIDTQEGKIRDQAKFYDDVVEKNDRIHKKNLKETISTYNTYLANSMPLESFKKINNQCEELTKENAELKFQIQQVDRNQTVSKEAYQVAWDNNEELKKQVAHWKKLAEDNFIQSVDDSETSDTFKNKYEELRKTYAVLLEDYNRDTGRDIWKEKYEHEAQMAESWKSNYYKKDVIKGHGYVFSEIPNDCDGQRFTDDLKKYLNKESYKLRVRGQYLDEKTKKAEGWRPYEYGQPMDKSKCLRVYVDIK